MLQDYSDRRLSQKYLGVVDRDFYEWETQIFFDDAFELGDNEDEQQVRLRNVSLIVIGPFRTLLNLVLKFLKLGSTRHNWWLSVSQVYCLNQCLI